MEEKEIYRKGYLLCFVALVFIILSSSTAFGTVIRVPGDYSTIQAGIDAASNGDTVSVADGTYVGLGNKDLDFNGKAITVKSDNGPESCVIDCEGNGRGFHFHSNETQTSVLNGFTIINGNADYGGGIRCSESPKIINCKIIGNTAEKSGGGIFCSVSLCTITNCIITANTSTLGGGIYCSFAQPQITNCTISGNTATLMNGGGIHINQSSPTITNCILWGDSPSEFSVNGIDSMPVVNYCDVESYEISSATIIHSDPLFVDISHTNPIKWDLHLLSSSPCIDSGTSEGAPNSDIDGNSRPQGSGYDIGAYEYAGSSPQIDANFSANPTSGTAPLTVNFTDLSTGTVDSWNWSFGDNSTSNDQNPSHTYNYADSYTVTLIVTGPEGSDEKSNPDYIEVIPDIPKVTMPWIPLLLLDDGGPPPTCPVILNGDFESGATIWTEYSALGWDLITTNFLSPVTPHSGSYAVWLAGDHNETCYIQQQITVPSACPFLSFYHWIQSDEASCNYDYAYVRINGVNRLSIGLCDSINTGGWIQRSVNLSEYAGQTVTLQFRAQTGESINSNWFVDDVSFQTTD